jgi:Ca2+-binding RTX toxin-like protein
LIDYRNKYLENLQPTTAGGFAGLQTLYASQGNYTALDNHELGNKQLINGGAPASLAAKSGNGTNDKTLNVNVQGINSYASNTNPEPSTTNPVRSILSFSLDAAPVATTVTKTSGDDKVIPTSQQTIFTDGGNDLVDGSVGGGSNRIYGGDGNDELYAGKNDRLFGEAGDDILDASQGKGGNRLYGGAGNDTLFAGSNDFLLVAMVAIPSMLAKVVTPSMAMLVPINSIWLTMVIPQI